MHPTLAARDDVAGMGHVAGVSSSCSADAAEGADHSAPMDEV